MTWLLLRCLLVLPVGFVLWLPMWWAAGRLPAPRLTPFFRLLVAVGGATVGWLGVLNLAGRALEDASMPRCAWLGVNTLATLWLLLRRRPELALGSLGHSWRSWAPVLLLALVVGAPQWLLAVSTPFWDEVASSSIHITAPNQFAEGVFPPRHNAFPDLPLKYHYASTMLAGTVVWLTGLPAGISVDVVSTALHLFVFLFIFHWLAQLGFRRLACFTGSFGVLLGGGLGFLYVPWLETYSGFPKHGTPGELLHRYQPELGWWNNLLQGARNAVFHLHNPDGSNSNLPWDIAFQFQQHAVALGIALSLFAVWLFCTWIRCERFSGWLFGACTFTFGLLFLAHAVFGAITCLTAGVLLAARWLARPTRSGLVQGALFAVGSGLLAFAHGGMLARGAAYGPNLMTLNPRSTLGYSEGGLAGFLNWNVAGLGLGLLLGLWTFASWPKRHSIASRPRRDVFAFFAIMLLASYLPPQLLFYSYGPNGIEEYTEIAKFFFVTHLALGMLAAFAVAWPIRPLPSWLVLPACGVTAIVPLFHIYGSSFNEGHKWLGFYRSPYVGSGVAGPVHMGETLRKLKRTPRDVYFDTAWEEPQRIAFLDELQLFAGSVFGVTPYRFERTGSFLISEQLVAERTRMSSRMARLRPGAEADAGCNWYYARPSLDFLRLPAIVRSRFDKLVAEKIYVEMARADPLVLYRIVGSSARIDDGIERYYRPRAVLQLPPRGGTRRAAELAFYDRRNRQLAFGEGRIGLPAQLADDFALIEAGRFGEGGRYDFAAARMADSYFSRGAQLAALIDYRAWQWSFHDATTGQWTPLSTHWNWDHDVPLLANLGGPEAELVAWNRGSGAWSKRDRPIAGAILQGSNNAVPLLGRFTPELPTTFAVYESDSGTWTMLPLGGNASQPKLSFRFGAPGDTLVPGDYDGDGIDDVALYRRADSSWRLRDRQGSVSVWNFGSATAVPVPADYDGDGALDLAYWEPARQEIRVSFDHGQSVGRVISVPPDALPAFVNMY